MPPSFKVRKWAESAPGAARRLLRVRPIPFCRLARNMQTNPSSLSDKNIVDRTRRQSASAKMVKDVRRQVTHSTGGAGDYEHEWLRSYAVNHVNARLAIPLFIAIVALVAMNWSGPLVAFYWALVMGLCYAVQISLCHRFLKQSDEEIAVTRWRNTFLASQLLVAFGWSLFTLYDCAACGIPGTFPIIQLSAILVVQALTMLLAYGSGAGLLATSAPPTMVLATRFFLTYETASLVMAAILIGAQVFFYLIANRFRLSIRSDLAFRAEREDLIAELETARSISEEARRRAEEANLAKSRFLATMSHELRTPLNAILGFSEMMKGEVLGPLGNESYKGYVADIHASGSHLLKIINEILDLSRIEAGRHELREEAIKLANVADEARHMVQYKTKQKGVTLVSEFEEDMPPIWADERAVRQVALNLLSNALKFTPSGGTIEMRVGWTSSGGQYFSVSDNGPGIPEEEIPIVLSSFGQGSIAIKSAEQGTGLGLPIVQALMHMHDGRFELKSKLREGTEAIAAFPRSRVLEVMERTENTGRETARPRPGIRKAS